MSDSENNVLKTIADQLNPCLHIRNKIDEYLQEEPPINLAKGGVIKEGINADLDDLRNLAQKVVRFTYNKS